MGNILGVIVHAANIADTVAGILVAMIAFQSFPSILKFCGDCGYRGTFVHDVAEKLGISVDISEKIKPHEWEKLPHRWIIERTLSWLNHSRRLSKDYEMTTSSEVAMVQISHFHTLLRRL